MASHDERGGPDGGLNGGPGGCPDGGPKPGSEHLFFLEMFNKQVEEAKRLILSGYSSLTCGSASVDKRGKLTEGKVEGDGSKGKGKCVEIDDGECGEESDEMEYNSRICYLEGLKEEIGERQRQLQEEDGIVTERQKKECEEYFRNCWNKALEDKGEHIIIDAPDDNGDNNGQHKEGEYDSESEGDQSESEGDQSESEGDQSESEGDSEDEDFVPRYDEVLVDDGGDDNESEEEELDNEVG